MSKVIEDWIIADHSWCNLLSNKSGGGRRGGCAYGGNSFSPDLTPHSPEDGSVITTATDLLSRPEMKPSEALAVHPQFPASLPPLSPPPPPTPNELQVSSPPLEDCFEKMGLSDITNIDDYPSSPVSQLPLVPPPQPASSMASSGDPCLSSLSSYMGMDCKLTDYTDMNYSPDSTLFFSPDPTLVTPFWGPSMGVSGPEEWPGIFPGNMTAAPETEIPSQEDLLDFQGGRCTDAAEEIGTFRDDWMYGDFQVRAWFS